ncbi:MAG: hypothetical protein IJ437_02730 [Clostridia bacterium]|nr:hypothetical protein [Clostridia bacterium]
MFNNSIVAAFFTGFSIGFGGISVAFQIFAVSTKLLIDKKTFVFSKFIQGCICGVIACLYVNIFKLTPRSQVESYLSGISNFDIIIISFFSIMCVFVLKNKIKSILFSKKC